MASVALLAEAMEPFMAAVVVGQLQIHAVRGALRGHHALQVSELCSAAMLLPCAATCPSVVARAAAVARGATAALLSSLEASSAVTRSSSDWLQ